MEMEMITDDFLTPLISYKCKCAHVQIFHFIYLILKHCSIFDQMKNEAKCTSIIVMYVAALHDITGTSLRPQRQRRLPRRLNMKMFGHKD